jgi:hypothetical protein
MSRYGEGQLVAHDRTRVQGASSYQIRASRDEVYAGTSGGPMVGNPVGCRMTSPNRCPMDKWHLMTGPRTLSTRSCRIRPLGI